MGWLRRGRAAAAALLLPLAAGAADRVLMLAAPDATTTPAVVERAVQAWAARQAGSIELVVREVPADPLGLSDGRRQPLPLQGPKRVIFATTMAVARAAQLQEPGTAIVFEGSADPLMMCLVDSLAQPGRNATGYTSALPDSAKMLDTLVDGFPSLRQVIHLVSADNLHPADCSGAAAPLPPCRSGLHEPDAHLERLQPTAPVREQARRRGVDLRFLLICEARDLALINALAARPDVGFIVPLHYLFYARGRALVNRIAATRRPAVYGALMFSRLGGLLAVETLVDEVDDRAAVDLLLKVLDGRAPAELPVLMPRGFGITVNAWAAAAQGLHPSLALLRRADQIIVQPPRR